MYLAFEDIDSKEKILRYKFLLFKQNFLGSIQLLMEQKD